MALVRVAQYNSTPTVVTDYQAQNAHLQAFTNQLLTQQFIIDAGTAQPVIKQGCYVSHGGSLYVADADTAITGSPSDGSVYIRVSGSTSLTVEFVTDISGYTWNPVYTALTSGSYTLLPYLIVKASTVWTRYNFNPNNQQFGSLAVGGTLAVTGSITGAKFIGPKVVEQMNESNIAQDFAGGELWLNFRGASSAITELRIANGIGDDGLIPVLCSSLNTGQGYNKLYAMNQNLRTTDATEFLSTLSSMLPKLSAQNAFSVAGNSTYTVPRGIYVILSPISGTKLEYCYNTVWYTTTPSSGMLIISDGTNTRLNNTVSSTGGAYYLKF